MANFEIYGEEDYGSLFLTQSSGSGNVVSLEENYGDKVVKSDKYSDISEDEGEELDKRLR